MLGEQRNITHPMQAATTSPAEALADLASYSDLSAEIEGLEATFLEPLSVHPDPRVAPSLALLRWHLTGALEALGTLQRLSVELP